MFLNNVTKTFKIDEESILIVCINKSNDKLENIILLFVIAICFHHKIEKCNISVYSHRKMARSWGSLVRMPTMVKA